MNNDNENQNKIAKQEAGQNTAHVAGRAASRYFGGEVGGKIYDAASRTKLGQAVEKGVGKRIAKAPVIGDVNKKLNDTGAVDAADKGIDLVGGKKSPINSATKGNRLNSGNLNKNKSKDLNAHTGNKSSFNSNQDATPNALKKKKNKPFAKRNSILGFGKKDDKEENSDSNDEQENQNDEEVSENNSNVVEETRGKKILKKLLPFLPMIGMFIIASLLVLAVISPIISAYSWFTSLFHHKDPDSGYTIYDKKDEENYKAEQAYNDAILGSSDGSVKGIISEYEEKYGVTIDWYLLNALITYRYVEVDNENLYSADGNDDISDEELEERLKNLEKESEESSEAETSNNSGIDYTEAKKKIETFASLMVIKEDGIYTTDKDKNGKVYNNILDSKTFSDYYKSSLKDNNTETKTKLLDTIYDYAEGARELLNENNTVNGGVIGDTSIVHVQTCKQNYTYQTINNLKVYNNPSWSEGTSYPDYLSMKDYIKGLVFREIGVSRDEIEAMKAQAIAGLTFLINDSHSGFNLKSGEMYFPGGTCRQATCSPEYGCTSFHEPTASSSGISTTIVGENSYRGNTHPPLNDKYNEILEEVLNAVFGKIMVKKGITSASFSGSSDAILTAYLSSSTTRGFVSGRTMSQKGAEADARSGMNYEQILAKYYTDYDYDIIDITEGLYLESAGDYNGTINLNENYHYHQGNYKGSNSFCEGGTISARGCSVTSTAIAVSILTNQKHDPVEISSKLKSNGKCNGNRVTYASSAAKLYNLNSYTISKDDSSGVKKMLSDLAKGNTIVVARMKENTGRYATKSGHYIALVGVKTEGGTTSVLVWDPAGNMNGTKRDNYWADFNSDILKYTNTPSFVVLSRR